jgi:hypothetical protein
MARFPDGPWMIEPELVLFGSEGSPSAVSVSRQSHGDFVRVVVQDDAEVRPDAKKMLYAQLIARTPDILSSLKELTVVLERQGINDGNRKAYLKAAMILETFSG